jgi:hypothetical protein
VRYPEIFNREARTFPIDEDLSISILLDYGFDKPSNAPAVAVVIHVTDPDTLDETLSYVRNIRYHVDVFFLTGSLESKAYIEKQLQDSYGQTEARIIASPGLDIAPRLVDCRAPSSRPCSERPRREPTKPSPKPAAKSSPNTRQPNAPHISRTQDTRRPKSRSL